MTTAKYLAYVRMSPTNGKTKKIISTVENLLGVEQEQLFPSNLKQFDFFVCLRDEELTSEQKVRIERMIENIDGVEKCEIYNRED